MDAGTPHKHSTAQRSCWPQHRGQGTQTAGPPQEEEEEEEDDDDIPA